MKLEQSAFNRLLIGAVGAGFIAVSMAGGAAVWTVRQNQSYSGLVSHTYEVERAVTDFRVSVEQLEAARRGYLLQPGDQRFLQTYREAAAKAPDQLRALRALTLDNANHDVRLDELGRLLTLMLIITDQSTGKVAMGGQVAAIGDFRADDAAGLLREIREVTEKMSREEGRLLALRARAQRDSSLTLYGILAIATILLTFIGVGSVWLITRYTRDLNEGRDALKRLNEGLEMAVRERTGDLKASNERLKTLLKEVNHRVANSLQLVSALVRLQSGVVADDNARSALLDTQRRIQAVAQVHRRLYTSEMVEEVEMLDYLAALVEDLQKTYAEGHNCRLTLVAEPINLATDQAVSLGVIVNELVTNAVKYAYPSGKGEVRIILARDGGQSAILTVEDDGVGMPAAETVHGTGLGAKVIAAMAQSLKSALVLDPTHSGVRASLRFAPQVAGI